MHLLIWKIRLPKRHTITILCLNTLALTIGLIIGYVRGINVIELIHISIFVLSLTFAYIITYTAIEADSPSLVMIRAIADTGKEGMSKEKFYELMSDDLLVIPRIKDILRDKLAYKNDDRYILTKKGRLFAIIFIEFRKLLKIEGFDGTG